MKFLLFFCLIFSSSLYSQLSGNISVDKREVISDISYHSVGKHPGILVFDIAVNRKGKVTGCTLNKSLSTIRNTPMMIDNKNKILTELTFAPSNSAPEFHQGRVTLNFNILIKETEN